MHLRIGSIAAPAIGDIRVLGEGDTIWLTPEAPQRRDWSRYLDAIITAVSHGADVRWAR